MVQGSECPNFDAQNLYQCRLFSLDASPVDGAQRCQSCSLLKSSGWTPLGCQTPQESCTYQGLGGRRCFRMPCRWAGTHRAAVALCSGANLAVLCQPVATRTFPVPKQARSRDLAALTARSSGDYLRTQSAGDLARGTHLRRVRQWTRRVHCII